MNAPTLSRRTVALTVPAVLALALVACQSGSPSGTTQTATTEGRAGTLRVGYFPLMHTASVVNASEAGHFEDAGLDVELVPTGGGAEAIPSLVSGGLDVVYGNYTSALLASQQGLQVEIVAGNDVGSLDHGIMVAADSDLAGAVDLAGARVAVNNLQNIGTVAVSALVEEAGGDPSSIRFVEMPFPNMQAALDAGQVDATWQVEPFRTISLQAGQVELMPLFSGPAADMPVAGWLTTTAFAGQNPETVAAFREALGASMVELQDDRERLVELVPTFTQVPAEVVEKAAVPLWNNEVDVERLTQLADLMLEYGVIDEPIDVGTVVTSP